MNAQLSGHCPLKKLYRYGKLVMPTISGLNKAIQPDALCTKIKLTYLLKLIQVTDSYAAVKKC